MQGFFQFPSDEKYVEVWVSGERGCHIPEEFDGTPVHRAFGVGVGYCGPVRNKQAKYYAKLYARLSAARLAVMDEFSMIGRVFFGKVNYKVGQLLGGRPRAFGGKRVVSMGGLDVVLSGHAAQAGPIGDDRMWLEGPYTGKGLNKPPKGDRPPDAPTMHDLANKGRLFRKEFEDVVLLRQVHRVDWSRAAVELQGNCLLSARQNDEGTQVRDGAGAQETLGRGQGVGE